VSSSVITSVITHEAHETRFQSVFSVSVIMSSYPCNPTLPNYPPHQTTQPGDRTGRHSPTPSQHTPIPADD
jgi:hypothetical protein